MTATAARPKIRTFKDMLAWQACRELYAMVFEVTKSLPKEEMFGLTSQMRRAANSAASNIAEGFGRQTKADKAHFYTMARGSITELQSHVQLANDVRLMDDGKLAMLENQCSKAHKLTVGLVKITQAHIS